MTIWLSVIIAIIAILMKVVYKGKGAGAPFRFARTLAKRNGTQNRYYLFDFRSLNHEEA